MVKFKNLAQMQEWIEKNTVKVLNNNMQLENILANAMSDSVWKVVYSHYEPRKYDRREDEGGLSDVRNMEINSVYREAGKVKITMDNLTTGNDSMRNKYISDTIIDGIAENWGNPDGIWTDKRDYISHAMETLRDNPKELMEVLKVGMISNGLKVK